MLILITLLSDADLTLYVVRGTRDDYRVCMIANVLPYNIDIR